MEWIITVIAAILGIAVGFGVGFLYRKKVAERAIGSAEAEATSPLTLRMPTGRMSTTLAAARFLKATFAGITMS